MRRVDPDMIITIILWIILIFFMEVKETLNELSFNFQRDGIDILTFSDLYFQKILILGNMSILSGI